MKLIITTMLMLFAFQLKAEAQGLRWKDLIPIIIGGAIDHNRPAPYPGYPPPPNRPYPGNPYPGQPYPGGSVSCRADDRGWEEHPGGHYSCGECLQSHGECIETCSSVSYECRVDGTDSLGRTMSFTGRGPDQWRAQDDAMYNCRYNYSNNCYVVNCQTRQDVVSRRDCRRF